MHMHPNSTNSAAQATAIELNQGLTEDDVQGTVLWRDEYDKALEFIITTCELGVVGVIVIGHPGIGSLNIYYALTQLLNLLSTGKTKFDWWLLRDRLHKGLATIFSLGPDHTFFFHETGAYEAVAGSIYLCDDAAAATSERVWSLVDREGGPPLKLRGPSVFVVQTSSPDAKHYHTWRKVRTLRKVKDKSLILVQSIV